MGVMLDVKAVHGLRSKNTINLTKPTIWPKTKGIKKRKNKK